MDSLPSAFRIDCEELDPPEKRKRRRKSKKERPEAPMRRTKDIDHMTLFFCLFWGKKVEAGSI